ncbi:hypothetical protein A5714_14095 [Mycobacterium sp. E2462]|uniref:sulfotransferase family protein n=1 Tax=Mycobacterium sp. E2462 TaxID=1834133 RepID=UPI00080254D8|nr:sulfotransferase [Mycobacterium sp. E2462]OBI14234.1 hypothetical protein A5714_14095 [Mycobacterium sp. E2462]
MQLFVVGPPRSGLTIVTQFLNRHRDVVIFDEIDLLQIDRFGGRPLGTLHAFLAERGVLNTYQRRAREIGDPAAALRSVMGIVTRPRTIWGEKNPRYATGLAALRRCFPGAVVLFVLRDPREIVNSCLRHRDSPVRSDADFWIKDTVTDALTQVERHLEPVHSGAADVVVLRYEAFTARPTAALAAALGRWGLTPANGVASLTHPAPETVGDHQFFRDGAALPWKAANLRPLLPNRPAGDRVDAGDPAWDHVEALARRFGYGGAAPTRAVR